MDRLDILGKIAGRFSGLQPDGNGEYWIVCPVCGEERKKKCSFSERGWKCFVCQQTGGLTDLAGILGMSEIAHKNELRAYRHFQPAPTTPTLPPAWSNFEDRYLVRMRADNRLCELWRGYKDIKASTVDEFKLGYGRLPLRRAETGEVYFEHIFRLIVPQFDAEGKLLGLYGRRTDGRKDYKWLGAFGSKARYIFGMERVKGGRPLAIVENRVDMMLMAQDPEYAEADVISLATARSLRPEEIDQIVALAPTHVSVCLDNDEHGQAQGELLRLLRAEWREKMIRKDPTRDHPDPPLYGKIVESQLRERGVDALCYEWPDDAPPKADVGWLYSKK
jgi:hypothetical protein